VVGNVWHGCKKRGGDGLYSGTIETGDDFREQYWAEIRYSHEHKHKKSIRCTGKYST
jgi:hypothetical protein